MARSEEKTDIFGNKYVQHYDDKGRKAGRSEFKAGILGPDYTEHFDADGNKTGSTEAAGGVLGPEYAKHYDADGSGAGFSEEQRGLFGGEHTQHYDERGAEIGHSHHDGDATEHHGDKRRAARPLIKPPPAPPPPPRFRLPTRERSSDDSSEVLNIVGAVLALVAALTVGFFIALWRYRYVRAIFLVFLTVVFQLSVFVSLMQSNLHFVVAAVIAAAISAPLFRFCFSALRWRAEDDGQRRVNAWQWAGVLAVLVLVGDITVRLTQASLPGPVYAAPQNSAPPTQQAGGGAASQSQIQQGEDMAFESAIAAGTIDALDAFLAEYPNGAHALSARERLQALLADGAQPVDVASVPAQGLQEGVYQEPNFFGTRPMGNKILWEVNCQGYARLGCETRSGGPFVLFDPHSPNRARYTALVNGIGYNCSLFCPGEYEVEEDGYSVEMVSATHMIIRSTAFTKDSYGDEPRNVGNVVLDGESKRFDQRMPWQIWDVIEAPEIKSQ